MTTSHTKYAVDLSNEGMALWQRDNDDTWQLLGKLPIDATDLIEEVERLKNGYIPDENGKLIAQVRIPRSEVFVSKLDLGGIKGDAVRSKAEDFLQENTPYNATDLLFDLENTENNNDAYVAAVAKTTIDEAKGFISSIGFKAQFYTTKIDSAEFPRQPKFYDDDYQKSLAALENNTKPNVEEIDDVPPPPKPLKAKPSKNKTNIASKKDPDAGIIKPLPETLTPHVDPLQTSSDKELIAPNKHGDKKEPKLSKTVPLVPQDISNEVITPVKSEIKNGALSSSNDIKMPQGNRARIDTRKLLKPRYILTLFAFILLCLSYWLYTVIFDGKDEIAQLNEISDVKPAIILTPDTLPQGSPTDNSPRISDNVSEETAKTTSSSPVLQPLSEAQPSELQTVASSDDASIPSENTADTEQAVGQTTETTTNSIEPTPNGTIGDEGIKLFSGTPNIIPPTRDALNTTPDPLKDILPKLRSREFEENFATTQEAIENTDIETVTPEGIPDIAETNAEQLGTDLLARADPSLKSKLPKIRPSAIAQKAKEANTSLLATADPALANLKPKGRPSNLKIPATAPEPKKVDAAEINVAIEQAVQSVLRPRPRPKTLANKAAKTKAATAKQVEKEAQQTAALTPVKAKGTAKASSPTAVSIQKEATEKSNFNKRRMSLVGVYGTASSRRALVRLPSGRYVKIKTGQKVSGWKVAAIGESSIRITKGSRDQVLRMPK